MADLENFGGGDFKHKTSKIRMSSPKLRVIFRPKAEIQTFFRPKSGGLQKKKKGLHKKLRVIFRPGSLGLGLWGGCELFEIEADFSAKIVTFRPKSATVENTRLEAKDTKKIQGQGHKKNPRPRPKTAFPRTDTLEAKERNARGQGPRTQAQVLSKKKKKKVFTKIFQAISKKKKPKNFSSAPQNFNNSKNSAVLEPRTGQFSRT